MALTSAERKSFEHIVTQLTTTDRWFNWRTAPRSRRGLWARRQMWHVIGTVLAAWCLVRAVRSLLAASTIAVGSAVAHLAQRMRTGLVQVAERLARWSRATWLALSHHLSHHKGV